MKVLYISGIFPTRGNLEGGGFITNQIKALEENLHSYNLIGLSFSKDKSKYSFFRIRLNEIRVRGVLWEVYTINYYFFGLMLLRLIPQLEKWLVSWIFRRYNIKNYDVIHGHWLYRTGKLIAHLGNKNRKPYLMTAHGSDIHTIPLKSSKLKNQILNVLENANKIVFVSDALLNQAKQLGYAADNAVVIPNGIDNEIFYRRELGIAEQYTGIKKEEVVIGYVGNLEYIKGADLLPEIAISLNCTNLKLMFIIIGVGKYGDTIKEKLCCSDVKYIMPGEVRNEQLPYYYSLMDLLIIPSRKEGFGIVALEALFCGTNIFARSVGGLHDLFKDTEMLAPNEDFKSSLVDFVKKEKYKADIFSSGIDVKKFTIENSALQYFLIYKELKHME